MQQPVQQSASVLARYRTRGLARICDKAAELDPKFAQVLRESARPAQIAYQKIMGRHEGNPVGVECRAVKREAWAFVLADVSCPGRFRIQYFDLDWFSGHYVHKTLEEAVEDMVTSGYRQIDTGALDRVAATERWALGVKRSAIMQRHQSGMIDWATAVGELSILQTNS